MTTGEKIAALRRELDLSQEALADKLGLSRQAVSKWEADQTVPGMENLVELAKLFGVSVDTLLRPDEPLPGKSVESPTAFQPNGYTISYKPELTKKTKWFIWCLSALIAVSVLCGIVSLVWLDKLQKQVDSMPTGMNTVYVPGPDTNTQPGDFTSIHNEVHFDGENLRFSCKVMPREAGGGAWFVLQGDETTLEAQALEENGMLKADITAPPAQTYILILRLQQDGKTRNLEVETFYDLNKLYKLGDTFVHAPFSWRGGTLEAVTVTVDVQPGLSENSVKPTGGRAELYISGELVETHELRVEENAQPIWHDADGPVRFAEGSIQLCADFSAHESPSIDAVEIRVTLTDNFGNEHQYSSSNGYE
ncbi:helix-turn-helix domain-containing protein [Agathobaculum sp.]|uniref:helix-turn-helix domain-containing protein n=1 Tax=Agathobaculum sp. TaxID=2048138 RepID=UPI002A805118|nr:helix-turn-helix domain-containing protein [Agathobaculum sp.]MDY3618843.1 helix-turn-helix domain-containing protein [Agathobaculum sp.]